MKSNNHRYYPFATLVYFVACALGLFSTGCITWGDTPTPNESTNITLRLSVPTQKMADSRAMSSAVESGINGTPLVLVFEQAIGNGEDTYAYSASVKGGTDAASYIVSLKPSTKKHKLLLLANITTALPSIASGSTISAVKDLLTFSAANPWSNNSYIPMWGETDYQTIGQNTQFNDANNAASASTSIRMIRALARVDVGLNYNADYSSVNGISGYTINSIRVYNSKTIGHTTGTSILNWPSGITAHVPSTTTNQNISYTTSGSLYAAEIYIPEATVGSSWEDENATGLVVGLTKNNVTEYHRIDFRDYVQSTMLHILRNHIYCINITSVNNAGFETADEAWKAKRITLGLEVKSWIFSNQNVALPGVTYLAVDKKEISIEGEEATNLAAFNIETNILNAENKQNWTVSTTDTWMNPQRDATTGQVLLLSPTRNLGAARTGTLTIQSPDGRLTLKVQVKQLPKVVEPTVASGANCYILTPGTNMSIQAYTGGQGSTGSLENVEAVSIWRHTNAGTDGYISNGYPTLDKTTGKVNFKLATTFSGNILIGIRKKDTQEVIWSWHIWVVDAYQQTQIEAESSDNRNFMDRNLGAHDNSGDISSTAYGCLYQWGRKDPLPGAESETGKRQGTIRYGESGKTTSFPVKVLSAANSTIAYATAHPDEFICISGDENWLGTNDRGLWGGDLVANAPIVTTKKTKYDPCPSGWRVPSGSIDSGTDGWPQFSNISPPTSSLNPYRVKIEGYGGYYPKAFYLDTTGKLVGTFQYQNGLYWTSSPSSDKQAQYLQITSTLKTNIATSRANACSIRCVRDR